MRDDVTYNEWIPYTDYEKAECDVKLKDGTIVYHCWPNAGKFNPLCSDMDEVLEEDVAEIMYRKYYVQDLCKGNCNGDNPESEREQVFGMGNVMNDADSYLDWKTHDNDFTWSNFPMRQPTLPFVRQEPKVQRNETCTCGSGKKYKKCCI
jgi:hypothetical protein